jgi:DNA helicase IV
VPPTTDQPVQDHPPSTAGTPADQAGELARERAHLADARRCLREMRENAQRLDALGGNEVSSEALAIALARRVDALADSPTTPLFFGRLDFGVPAERFHIGRRHVRDDSGDPMVLDWRADLSRVFYRAHPGDPMGLVRRRRFGFSAGELTAFEDETFGGAGATGADGASRLLAEEIERPRTGPMRDIVATIQPEQDEIVRARLEQTVCVQGAPGTGKTAVGLHRAAYLLYAHRERLRRSKVLIVGPNRSFLGYIASVLPALGEVDVEQRTLPELVAHVPVRGTDEPAVARLKGDIRMAKVLRRAVLGGVRKPVESLVVPLGGRRWRVAADDVRGIARDVIARDVRYAAARSALAHGVGAAVVRLMEEAGDAPSDRAVEQISRTPAVKAFVDLTMPPVKPKELVRRLLTDPAALAAAAANVLTDAEQALLQRAAVSSRWSQADAVLVDEVTDLLDRTPSYGHVVLDEAQDLSPMACRAIGRRCSTGSATVLGDLAQGTAPESATSWAETLEHLGKPDGIVEVLTKGYRVPAQVIEFASRLLPRIAPGVAAAVSVRQAPGSLRLVETGAEPVEAAVGRAVADLLQRDGSVGVIAADVRVSALSKALRRKGVDAHVLGSDDELTPLTIVPATLAKGLEFDAVVVVEPAEIVAAESMGLRRLYVVLTRAVSELVVVFAEPLPAELSA